VLFVVTQYCRLWRLKPEGTANWSWELWREEISGTNMVLSYAAKCKFPCQLSPDAVGGEGTSGTAHEFSGTRLIYSSVTNPGTWPNSSSATKPSAKRHCGDPPALPSLALSLCKPRNGEKKINVSKKVYPVRRWHLIVCLSRISSEWINVDATSRPWRSPCHKTLNLNYCKEPAFYVRVMVNKSSN